MSGHNLYEDNNLNIQINEQMLRKNIETDGAYQAKVSGDYGEYSLSSVLKSLPDCYHVINDVLLFTKKGSTQIDHIIVSPFGIFVVETKNHKGMIFGDMNGKVWTQVLKNRGHFIFYNPVWQNNGHLKHLIEQLKIKEHYFTGVIVFTSPDVNLNNVNCPFCIPVNLVYDYIMSFTNQIMSEKQIWEAIRRIDKIDKSGYENNLKHVEYVNKFKERDRLRREQRNGRNE